MSGIVALFAASPFLTRAFLSSHYYLDILIEEWTISRTMRDIKRRLRHVTDEPGSMSAALAQYRRFEEIRLGMLFLLQIISVEDLCRGLSQLAQAIVSKVVSLSGCRDIAVIALGKLGGREMTFGSDLDIIFVSDNPDAMRTAEMVMRALTYYSDMGLLYKVDTRLRPDGSKGPLVNTVEGYRAYYADKAHNWEIQALLKARPAGGSAQVGRAFLAMARDVLICRGGSINGVEILDMRKRIVRELSHESEGIDIKLGPGGIEEIEFCVQSLQLQHAAKHPYVLVQNTGTAIRHLMQRGLLRKIDAVDLYDKYRYLRGLETLLRLHEEDVFREGAHVTEMASVFMKASDTGAFFHGIQSIREDVLDLISRINKP